MDGTKSGVTVFSLGTSESEADERYLLNYGIPVNPGGEQAYICIFG